MSDPVSEAKSQMGMVALTALVLGNMVGSGVFMLPAALAPYGGTSVLAWCLSAGGAMLFGLVIARLARRWYSYWTKNWGGAGLYAQRMVVTVLRLARWSCDFIDCG